MFFQKPLSEHVESIFQKAAELFFAKRKKTFRSVSEKTKKKSSFLQGGFHHKFPPDT